MNRAKCTRYPSGPVSAESVVLVPILLFEELQEHFPEETIDPAMRCRNQDCSRVVGLDGFDGYCGPCADVIDAEPCECGGERFTCACTEHAYPGGHS